MRWAVAAFAAAGALWAARGVLATADPSYYAPVTVIDYAAVGLYSLALALTGIALVLLERFDGVRAHRVARAGLFVGAIGGIVACFANFGEDWLGIAELSLVYVASAIALFLGIVLLGVSLGTRSRKFRWIGALLLVPVFAPLLGQAVGFTIGGVAFVACAALLARMNPAERVSAANLAP